jgi:hypothetical protein
MPSYNDAASISRATSTSRRSTGTTVSRSRSLIQRQTQTNDLRPSDVLIERFVAWKAIVKQLIAYFEVGLTLLILILMLLHLYNTVSRLSHSRRASPILRITPQRSLLSSGASSRSPSGRATNS